MIRSARPTDLAAVTKLVVAHDVALFDAPDWDEDDQREEWARPGFELERDTWTAWRDDELIAYGSAWARDDRVKFVDGCVHPDHWGKGLGAMLLARYDEWMTQRDPAANAVLQTVVPTIDGRALELVADHGYGFVRRWWQMWIEVTESVTLEPPDGIVVRAFEMADAPAVHACTVEAFAEHWDSHVDSFEVWSSRWFDRPGFDPHDWYVALEGDELVGCVCGLPTLEDAGWIRNVSVRPAWRGRGIAKSLLTRSFSSFASKGRRRVGLGVDSTNQTGAPRLYERVGMHVEKTFDFHEKPWRR